MKRRTDPLQAARDAFAAGEQYQRDVAAKAEQMGPLSPEFAQWCREMDEWRAAIAAADSSS